MKAYIKTSVGLVRQRNEDSMWISEGDHGLFILADGMGGHRAGDVASSLAARTMAHALASCQAPSSEAFMQAFAAANYAVFRRQKEDVALSGMGTTLTALWEDDETVLLGHVGDSRAYLYRDGVLRQMTQDHSVVGEMLREGVISEKQARSHPFRNVITRAVGTEDTLLPDVFPVLKQPGDVWLLCSDGLTDMAEDAEIAQVLAKKTPEDAADALVDLALGHGGSDNVSVLLLEVEG